MATETAQGSQQEEKEAKQTLNDDENINTNQDKNINRNSQKKSISGPFIKNYRWSYIEIEHNGEIKSFGGLLKDERADCIFWNDKYEKWNWKNKDTFVDTSKKKRPLLHSPGITLELLQYMIKNSTGDDDKNESILQSQKLNDDEDASINVNKNENKNKDNDGVDVKDNNDSDNKDNKDNNDNGAKKECPLDKLILSQGFGKGGVDSKKEGQLPCDENYISEIQTQYPKLEIVQCKSKDAIKKWNDSMKKNERAAMCLHMTC